MKRLSFIITLFVIASLTCVQTYAKKKNNNSKKAKTEKVFITKANATKISVFVRSKKFNDESFLVEFQTDGTNVIVGYPKDRSKCITYNYPEKFLKACEVINKASITIKSKSKVTETTAGDLVQLKCYHGKEVIFTMEKCNQVKNCNGNLDSVVCDLIKLANGNMDNFGGTKDNKKDNTSTDKSKKDHPIQNYEKNKE